MNKPLIESARNVRTQRTVWRIMRQLLLPINAMCAGIAGAHKAHQGVLNPLPSHLVKKDDT